MIMMSKKDKRLYNQIQYSRNKKTAEVIFLFIFYIF